MVAPVLCSKGDSTPLYTKCYKNCESICFENKDEVEDTSLYSAFTWSCEDNCKYECMWNTVDVLEENNKPILQFHGKWPFKRYFGLQEPASSLFSFMNGLSHIIAFKTFRSRVPTTAPMFNCVKAQALVAVNAWFWSTLFHAKDNDQTEKMDYFSATSLVLFCLYFAIHRLSMEHDVAKRNFQQKWARKLIFSFFVLHVAYLSNGKFDYGYNMNMNVTAGVISTILYLKLWWSKRQTCPHMWKIAASVLLTNLCLTFELFDFPPYKYLIDAHSLWHLFTIPLPFLVYSFNADDCLHLKSRKKVD